ncbi:MAG: hypothetical protein EXR66_07255 [Dehalococcoidia bacterium]|nr:hypothetical protein [Dehalococcoidia bacterium]
MVWLSAGIAMLGGLLAPAILRDADLTTQQRALTALLVVGACVVGGFVGLIFSRLNVRAGIDGVRAGFGHFATLIAPEHIEGVHAERYRWLRFGGWGLRFGWNFRNRAYSVPFVQRGVTIRLQGGRTVFVSSREPERLAAAIDELACSPSGAMAT